MFRRCVCVWRHIHHHREEEEEEEEGEEEGEHTDYETSTEAVFHERDKIEQTCKICREPKSPDDMFDSRTCSHTFCKDCIGQYIATKLKENLCMFKCPKENCKALLDLEQCKSLVSSDVFENWGNALCESSILEKQRFYCPFRDCSLLMVNDGREAVTESVCPKCQRMFCAKCKVPWHAGMKCRQYQKLGVGEREEGDVIFFNLAKYEKWKRCPRCKFYVERNEGCLHMTCRCNYQFCYGCGSKWSSRHEKCSS